jgi:hypothetical protein
VIGRHSSRTAALQTLRSLRGIAAKEPLFLGTGVEGVCTQVQDDPGEVLGYEGNFAD